jgi:hypothetical protein
MQHVINASNSYFTHAQAATRPVQPSGSLPSPRKVKAISRLAEPRIRNDNNINDSVNEYGERIIIPTSKEQFYSDFLDEIAHEVHVPNYMRQRIILGIIETEHPRLYQTMKHFNAHFMTSSEARQTRMGREKLELRKPSTLQGCNFKSKMNQELVTQDNERSRQFYTETLIKVLFNETACTRSVSLYVLHRYVSVDLLCFSCCWSTFKGNGNSAAER